MAIYNYDKMAIYNYKRAVRNDIIAYIDGYMDFADYTTIGELEDALFEAELENEDYITGNASGSYTLIKYLEDRYSIPANLSADEAAKYTAGENLIGNFDLLADALHHFGCEFSGDEEGSDVLIRRYLVDDCIHDAIEEIEDDYNEFWEELERLDEE